MRIIIEDYPYGEQELRGIIPARMLGWISPISMEKFDCLMWDIVSIVK